MFEKQSMINRISNPINRNRLAAKILKVMGSSRDGYLRPDKNHPVSDRVTV